MPSGAQRTNGSITLMKLKMNAIKIVDKHWVQKLRKAQLNG
jgi:hypothetical protein